MQIPRGLTPFPRPPDKQGMRPYHSSAYDFARTVDSHWEASAPPLGLDLEPLEGKASAEVAIVGGGYTGLNAALRLAGAHGRDVAVLEAGPIGWGASGRNGGFCCIGSAKLSYGEMIRKFGIEATREFFQAQCRAVDHVATLIETHAIAADRTETGEIQLAHRPNRVKGLLEELDFLEQTFGVECRFLAGRDLAQEGAAGPLFHGGLFGPIGFGLHPLKYLRGLARATARAGVRLHPSSPVTRWREEAGLHVLSTPNGEIRARQVLVATNGYTDERIPPALKGRLLPALSTVLVTRPLTAQELAAQGWTTRRMAYDTRDLLHYFRLLPCGRFLFGGRGGTDAHPHALSAIATRLRRTFEAMFPAWAKVETERRWSGLVCLSLARTPYAGPMPGMERTWIAAAYHGNGVAMGSYAGAKIADVVAGAAPETSIPKVMRGPLRRFPAEALRLQYLKAIYVGFGLRDEWL